MKKILLLTIVVCICTIVRSQSVYFNFNNGTQTSYNLEDVRKITFNADVMSLHLWGGTIYSWNVSTIEHYQYSENMIGVEEVLALANEIEVNVYPNPTKNILHIAYTIHQEDEIKVSLYSLDGRLVLYKVLGRQISGEHLHQFEIAEFPAGTYECILNGKNFSISKQIIKQ